MKTLVLLILLTMCTYNTLWATDNGAPESPREEIEEVLKEALRDKNSVNYGYWVARSRRDDGVTFYEIVATNKSNSRICAYARIKDKMAGRAWIDPGYSAVVFSSLDPFPVDEVRYWAIPAQPGDIW